MSEQIGDCVRVSSPVTQEMEKLSLLSRESEIDVSLNGDLKISDYLCDVPPTPKTLQDISAWTEKQREITRMKLSLWLVKFFGCSLLCTFVLTGAATFSSHADKELIRDLFPQFITAQGTLLGVVYGFYFSNKGD